MAWIFFLVFFPVLACVFFWAVLSGIRIFAKEDPTPAVRRAYARRIRSQNSGRPIKVGARDIREDYREISNQTASSYNLENNTSSGLPSVWVDELWARRN